MKRKSVEVFLSTGKNNEKLQVTVAEMPYINKKLTAEAGKKEILKFLDSRQRQIALGVDNLMTLFKTPDGIVVRILQGKAIQTTDPIAENVFRDHVENAPSLEAFMSMCG
jgi:hypothetical protein